MSPVSPTAARRSYDAGAIRDLFARGSVWALVNYGVAQVLRLGSNLVFWHLLRPEAFGLMAIVNVFLQGLGMFSDLGITQSIVQSERGEEPRYLNTVWTIQLVRGVLIWLAACVAAVPLAHLYQQPDLAYLVPFVGASTVLVGLNSTKLASASRHLAVRRLTIIDLASQAASLAVMIPLAYVSRSVWALAVGATVAAAARLYLSHHALPGVANRLCWDADVARSVSHFGRWVFVSSLLTFLAQSSDRLIFGTFISIDMLGVYSVALVWATIPEYVVGHVVSAVVFPLFSRVQNEGGPLRTVFVTTRRPVLIAAGWLTACLLVGGPSLIRFLYDQRAADAGWIIQVLAVGIWFQAIEHANSAALLALGKPKWLAMGNAAKVAGMVVAIPLGASLYGFRGAVIGFSFCEVLKYVVSALGVRRAGLGGLAQDLGLATGLVATVGVGLAIRGAVGLLPLPLHAVRLQAFAEGAAILMAMSLLWLGVHRLGSASAVAAGKASAS